MTATLPDATPLPPAQFAAALSTLVITMRPDGSADIGPILDDATDHVAAFLGEFLVANPALAEVVRRRLKAAPERNGERGLPVLELLGVFDTTARHGAPARHGGSPR